MPKRVLVIALVAATVLVCAGCRREGVGLTGSRYTSFGPAQLVTQFYEDRSTHRDAALLNLLFIAPFDPQVGDSYGWSGSGSGNVGDLKFSCAFDTFDGHSRKSTVRSHDVHVRNGKTVQADGHSFDLTRGNTFIAHINPDGSLRITQVLLQPSATDDSPTSVLEAIKRHAPTDQRVQALTASP